MIKRILFFVSIVMISCHEDGTQPVTPGASMYFPVGSIWERETLSNLGWNEAGIIDLDKFLTNSNTRAFIVLQNGRIAIEKYMGKQLVNTTLDFTPFDNWYWASAGKTMTSVLMGIAESQGKLSLDTKTSVYLGSGWSSLTTEQEDKITLRHQLSMTTGLDDEVDNPDCTDPSCLTYKADPGTRWAYHNAPYTLLDGVISSATNKSLNDFASEVLLSKIGMDGQYIKTGDNNVFYSTARSMARFGLLLLNRGKWDGEQIFPENYYFTMTSSSQNFNLAYGYLTWLNGKANFILPGSQVVFNGYITPNAPVDMISAIGKNGQLINVVPSKRLVVIRLGDAPDNQPVPLTFQDDLWKELNKIIP